jgi:hypothetical protein
MFLGPTTAVFLAFLITKQKVPILSTVSLFPQTQMNVSQSFSYMFKDGSWFYKVFVGGLFVALSSTTLGIPFILGYQIRHVRDMIEKEEDVLPEWKNIAGMFRDGLAVLCALAIYLAVLVSATFVAGAALSLTSLGVSSGVIIFFWMPLVVIQYAKKPTFLACFALVTLTSPVAKRPSAFAATMGISIAVMTAVFALGWMSLIIGWPFVIFWGITVQSHIFGQLARLQ